MDAKTFYAETKKFLNRKATASGVADLKKYYVLTDHKMDWFKNEKLFTGNTINEAFAQLVFHGQNATMISNIVKFEENYAFLKKFTLNFDPKKFYAKYCSKGTEDEQIANVVKAFKYNHEKKEGLIWNSEKSKEENKDKIAKRFAKLLINGSKYLKDFKTKTELVDDLLAHHTLYKHGQNLDDNRNLIKYFMGKMDDGSGFSVALTCDYLKELDLVFNFLAKPDVHIMDVMAVYKNKDKGYYYNTESKAYECLKEFQKLVKEINQNLKGDNKITVYQLDRMIWLICSGKFFLDTIGLNKADYLKVIK